MITTFTIGKLAKAAGVNIETVRYYQRVNLITEPSKPKTGYRLYPEDTVSRIRFIKRAQELGFTLKEIKELLLLGDSRCQEVQQLTQQKLSEIESRLHDLTAMKAVLTEMLERCRHDDQPAHCALIDALNK